MRSFTVRNAAAPEETILLIHDATELDYTGCASLAGALGQIGNGSRRGFLCQNVLAVDPQTKSVLGLMNQVLHRRDDVPPKETLTERRDRETRESLLWINGTRHLLSPVWIPWAWSFDIHLPASLRSTGVTRLRRYYGRSDSCRAVHLAPGRSHCFMCLAFQPFRLQPTDRSPDRFNTLPFSFRDFP